MACESTRREREKERAEKAKTKRRVESIGSLLI